MTDTDFMGIAYGADGPLGGILAQEAVVSWLQVTTRVKLSYKKKKWENGSVRARTLGVHL